MSGVVGKFWRVKRLPGWHAVEQFYDEQGRLHTRSLSAVLRATEVEAIADGVATGLPMGFLRTVALAPEVLS